MGRKGRSTVNSLSSLSSVFWSLAKTLLPWEMEARVLHEGCMGTPVCASVEGEAGAELRRAGDWKRSLHSVFCCLCHSMEE